MKGRSIVGNTPHLVRICPYSVPFALNAFLLQQHRPGFPKAVFVIHDLTSFIVL